MRLRNASHQKKFPFLPDRNPNICVPIVNFGFGVFENTFAFRTKSPCPVLKNSSKIETLEELSTGLRRRRFPDASCLPPEANKIFEVISDIEAVICRSEKKN